MANQPSNRGRHYAELALRDVRVVGTAADQSLLRCVSAVPRRKAPDALGQPATKVWAEIWDLIGPRTEAALEPAESTFDEALLLIMERCGYPEETYFTFSYSPLRNMQETSAASLLPLPDETFAHHSRTPAQAFARGCRRLVGSAYARTGRRCGGQMHWSRPAGNAVRAALSDPVRREDRRSRGSCRHR